MALLLSLCTLRRFLFVRASCAFVGGVHRGSFLCWCRLLVSRCCIVAAKHNKKSPSSSHHHVHRHPAGDKVQGLKCHWLVAAGNLAVPRAHTVTCKDQWMHRVTCKRRLRAHTVTCNDPSKKNYPEAKTQRQRPRGKDPEAKAQRQRPRGKDPEAKTQRQGPRGKDPVRAPAPAASSLPITFYV